MKVAVSIPDSIFEAAEKLAQERNMPRSQVFAEALAEYLDTHSHSSITRILDQVYSQEESRLDPELNAAQLSTLDDEAW